MTALHQATEVVDPVPGAGAPHLPQQPDLVQLLTPEGERVEHPDYALDISDDELRAPLPRPRAGAPVGRRGHRAAAAGRARHLGLAARARRPRRSAPAARCSAGDMAFPTYREHGVAWTRGVDPLQVMGLFRGVDNGGWNPAERGFNLYTIVIGSQCLHATGYAMGVQRDGAESAVLAFLGDGATSQGEVNEAMIFAASFSAPGRLLLPEQPVRDQRAARAPVAGPAVPARRRLRLPRRAGRRQRRPRRPGRHPGGARRPPARARARPSSRRSPTGWARTPPPTTRPATGWPASSRSGSCATRSPG